jgi:hypothetical protein
MKKVKMKKIKFDVKARPEYRDVPKYAKLGEEPIEGQIVDAWYINKDDLKPFDPGAYFQTSGEAVAKGIKMLSDAHKFVGRLQSLVSKLKKTKANNKFLEVGHDDFQIVCKNKNPRVFKKKEDRKIKKKPEEDDWGTSWH